MSSPWRNVVRQWAMRFPQMESWRKNGKKAAIQEDRRHGALRGLATGEQLKLLINGTTWDLSVDDTSGTAMAQAAECSLVLNIDLLSVGG